MAGVTTFLLLILVQYALCDDLIVDLPNGKVQGTSYTTPSNKKFYAWRKIPYAQPPLGSLRFLPPVKPNNWEGILDATDDGPACLFFINYQGDPIPRTGNSEDCLYINVYTPFPVNSSSSVLTPTTPVMFYIYGGGFVSGTATFDFYDPAPLLEENVIYVSFNYRLGTYGFLSTEDDVISGNAGLKDQWLALTWARENIRFFGGNPEDITIFGESAGGMSVGYHLFSPMSRGLFAAAILESGTEITSFFQVNARDFAVSLANKFNSNITVSSSSEDIKNVLQRAPADLLIDYTKASGHNVYPVLESPSINSFLINPLYEELVAGNVSKVPIIIGNVEQESAGFLPDLAAVQQFASSVDQYPEKLVPDMTLKNETSRREIGEKIHELYVGKDGSFTKNLSLFMNWYSDNLFLRGIYKHSLVHSQYAPTYLYQFSFFGSRSQNHVNVPGSSRVGHADELAYLFNISTYPIQGDKEYLTRKRIAKLWTNFAKTKNPTPDKDLLFENVKWESVNKWNKMNFLNIGDNLEMKNSDRKLKETPFWDDLWETYAKHPFNSF